MRMKLLLTSISILLLTTIPSAATDKTITLNDQEQKNLIALLDLAVKSGGLKAASAAASIITKIVDQDPTPPLPEEKK